MKKIDKNQKLYSFAKKIIPGGTMLFSKRPENYLPGKWPTYFKKAKGAYIWDLNNNKFLDMFFGVGQNVLGYANDKIEEAISMLSSLLDQEVSESNKLEDIEQHDIAAELLKDWK